MDRGWPGIAAATPALIVCSLVWLLFGLFFASIEVEAGRVWSFGLIGALAGGAVGWAGGGPAAGAVLCVFGAGAGALASPCGYRYSSGPHWTPLCAAVGVARFS
jgi:hypothetical protein